MNEQLLADEARYVELTIQRCISNQKNQGEFETVAKRNTWVYRTRTLMPVTTGVCAVPVTPTTWWWTVYAGYVYPVRPPYEQNVGFVSERDDGWKLSIITDAVIEDRDRCTICTRGGAVENIGLCQKCIDVTPRMT